jgi:Ni/Co efflux regulator RcnB
MKLLSAILLGSAILVATPAFAQDRNNNMSDKGDNVSRSDEHNSHHEAQTATRRPVAHHSVSRRATYQRSYKTDDEEHQQTEKLNGQYRGVSGSDAR